MGVMKGTGLRGALSGLLTVKNAVSSGSSGAKRCLRTKSSLIPLKELKNGKRNNSQSQSLTPHPNPIENIKSDGFYYNQKRINGHKMNSLRWLIRFLQGVEIYSNEQLEMIWQLLTGQLLPKI